MQEPTKEEIADYVADIAEQLAAMSQEHIPRAALMLRAAAKLARKVRGQEPDL